jgi:CRISPR system Cascade subunit CasE
VLAAFPEPPTGALGDAPRVLWRLDVEPDARTHLYVVSPDRPDFAHIAEEAGWPSTERGKSKDYRAFLDRLEPGQRWAFRLTANPTQYVVPERGGRAKRVAHVSVQYQEKWLFERAERAGFRIASSQLPGLVGDVESLALRVTRRATHQFSRRGAQQPVTLAVAQFDGVLTVEDVPALRRSLVAGVGPGKAYGCGLMTLVPVA